MSISTLILLHQSSQSLILKKFRYALYGLTFRLSNLCWHLDIKAKCFHIPGNDAAYTLPALLRLAAETSDHASIENIQGIISSLLAEPRSAIERVWTVTPLDWADNLDGSKAINA